MSAAKQSGEREKLTAKSTRKRNESGKTEREREFSA